MSIFLLSSNGHILKVTFDRSNVTICQSSKPCPIRDIIITRPIEWPYEVQRYQHLPAYLCRRGKSLCADLTGSYVVSLLGCGRLCVLGSGSGSCSLQPVACLLLLRREAASPL